MSGICFRRFCLHLFIVAGSSSFTYLEGGMEGLGASDSVEESVPALLYFIAFLRKCCSFSTIIEMRVNNKHNKIILRRL